MKRYVALAALVSALASPVLAQQMGAAPTSAPMMLNLPGHGGNQRCV